MKREIKTKLKDAGFKGKVTFKKHSDYGENDSAAIHMRLLDIDFDIDEAMRMVERDLFNHIVFYLEIPSYYKYRRMLDYTNHTWTEGEINQLRKSLGPCSNWSIVARETIISDYFRHCHRHNFKITEDQSNKGIEWLKKTQLKKNGELRNSQSVFINEGDKKILENFSHFKFIGLEFSDFNYYSNSYRNIAPIYRTFDKSGNYFDYAPIAFGSCGILDRGYKQINFNDSKNDLTENDIQEILEVVCKSCQIKTWNKIRTNLELFPSSIPVYGILGRLIKENSGWSYCAGQSYPDEIRTVRNILLNLK